MFVKKDQRVSVDLRFNRVAENTIWLLENENSIMANSDLLSGLWDAV